MDKPVKLYRICYRMECFVEATSEDEALQKYDNGEAEDSDYVQFISIEDLSDDN